MDMQSADVFTSLSETPLFQSESIARNDVARLKTEHKRLNDLFKKQHEASAVDFVFDRHGQIVARLQGTDQNQVSVLLHGANPVSCKTIDGYEVTFLSEHSQMTHTDFDRTKAARGGLFACLPEFGPSQAGGQHGFGRVSEWRVAETTIGAEDLPSLSLELNKEDIPPALDVGPWRESDFVFRQEYHLRKDGIEMFLQVDNIGDTPFSVRPCYHSYYRSTDSYLFEVRGLENCLYMETIGESTPQQAAKRLNAPVMHAEGIKTSVGLQHFPGAKEIELTFFDIPDTIELLNHADAKKILLQVTGFDSLVTWNPHIAKGCAMADFKDGEHTRMFCVEPVLSKHAEIVPGESLRLGQKIIVEDI